MNEVLKSLKKDSRNYVSLGLPRRKDYIRHENLAVRSVLLRLNIFAVEGIGYRKNTFRVLKRVSAGRREGDSSWNEIVEVMTLYYFTSLTRFRWVPLLASSLTITNG